MYKRKVHIWDCFNYTRVTKAQFHTSGSNKYEPYQISTIWDIIFGFTGFSWDSFFVFVLKSYPQRLHPHFMEITENNRWFLGIMELVKAFSAYFSYEWGFWSCMIKNKLCVLFTTKNGFKDKHSFQKTWVTVTEFLQISIHPKTYQVTKKFCWVSKVGESRVQWIRGLV